jgi:acetolactate synthase-1/3 small subunit
MSAPAMSDKSEKHTISCLVENHFGVLARIAGLISARGFNIDSLTVSATEDPTVSRMTIVVDADALKLEQVKRQLDRLIDVIEVEELKEGEFIDRELLLVRIAVDGAKRAQLLAIAETFGGKTADAGAQSLVIEAMGDSKQMNALIEQLRPYGIRQLVRTGRIAMPRREAPSPVTGSSLR